jgi:hypothetical protein
MPLNLFPRVSTVWGSVTQGADGNSKKGVRVPGIDLESPPPPRIRPWWLKMEQTECSETSAYKIQTPGNYPEESIQHCVSSLESSVQRL